MTTTEVWRKQHMSLFYLSCKEKKKKKKSQLFSLIAVFGCDFYACQIAVSGTIKVH